MCAGRFVCSLQKGRYRPIQGYVNISCCNLLYYECMQYKMMMVPYTLLNTNSTDKLNIIWSMVCHLPCPVWAQIARWKVHHINHCLPRRTVWDMLLDEVHEEIINSTTLSEIITPAASHRSHSEHDNKKAAATGANHTVILCLSCLPSLSSLSNLPCLSSLFCLLCLQ